jgi:hypothetical protein
VAANMASCPHSHTVDSPIVRGILTLPGAHEDGSDGGVVAVGRVDAGDGDGCGAGGRVGDEPMDLGWSRSGAACRRPQVGRA